MGRRAASQELVALGERIRERRTELCLSQEALAEKAETSANTVSRIEGGQMSMGIGTFIKLVKALDTDAGSLLGLPSVSEEKRYRDMCYRVSHLRAVEQEIVLRTVEVLVENLRRER